MNLPKFVHNESKKCEANTCNMVGFLQLKISFTCLMISVEHNFFLFDAIMKEMKQVNVKMRKMCNTNKRN